MALSWTTAGYPHPTRPTPPPPLEPRPFGDADGRLTVGPDARWRRFRFGLLAAVLVLAASISMVSERMASWSELTTALASGRVGQVRVVGALPPEATGTNTARIFWRDGQVDRLTEVKQVRGDVQPGSTTDKAERVQGDLVQQLLDASGGNAAITTEDLGGYSYGPTILGWRTPVWVGLAVLALWACALALLISGPEPWWATRWAWFWLLSSPLSVIALPLFLLASGSPPGVPQAREPGFRLTGGWAFLIMAFFGGAIAAALGLTS